ncbi:hypothetical protein [Brevibacillus sp. SYSU BS000544]|uniref:hypothetical protein n=1 Tax=Brevibacillus sp. SYSU BS000544 TaxID=3416443 RepID=UPI003CE5844F
MFARGLLGKVLAGGLLAAIGYMLMPKRRNRMMMFTQWPMSRRNLWKMGRSITRAFAK